MRAWGDFFANLAAVVVDEAHVYRGVFGSHVGNVLRRLRRIAARLRHRAALPAGQRDDRQPGRAGRAAHRPGGLRARRRRRLAGARAPDRDVEPAAAPTRRSARARSALGEAADLLAELVRGGARTICFMKSRKARRADGASSSATRSRPTGPELADADRALPRRLHAAAAARAGARGSSRASCSASSRPTRWSWASTSARSTPRSCVTFPGTVASLRQMWGRAGRRGRGLAVYVAGEDALDQFFCRHPDEFLDRPVEAAILDHENEQIHRGTCCAPRTRGRSTDADARVPRAALARARRAARRAPGELRRAPRRASSLRRPEDYPAARVSLRSASRATSSRSSTPSSGEMLGTVEAARAFTTVARRRHLPAHGPLLRGRASSTSTRAARWCSRSTATGTRSPRRRRRPRSSGCSTGARRWA